MAAAVETTTFSRDVQGRFICNTFEEALDSTRDGASPFHHIVIGGGLFGGTLASFLMNLDPASPADDDPFTRYHSRILVLEAGPMLLPEHEQNLANIGVGVPGNPEFLAGLQPNPADRRARPGAPRNEVWGLPWHSKEPFIGTAYCVGGKSLFWGGWAPRFLPSEMPTNGNAEAKWPERVVADLEADDGALWRDAAHQIGADDPNDFVNGELHARLRDFYFQALGNGNIRGMIPVAELPDYVDRAKLPGGANAPGPELRLDAPYAVQSSTRSGFFPLNKFSSVPLLMAAARKAASDSQKTDDTALNDSRKQFMLVPNCHVVRLRTLPVGADGAGRRVVAIETGQGTIPVADNATVILACGAVESARLALLSFADARGAAAFGQNLMVHLRTNTRFTLPRTFQAADGTRPFDGIAWDQLEVSAVQLRGRVPHPDGTQGHFHLQVVASGVRAGGDGNADSEIFRKIPDIDQFAFFRDSRDDEVAIAVRGIGEMSPKDPDSAVVLDPEEDEYGARRALVRLNDRPGRTGPAIDALNGKDQRVRAAMVGATNDVLGLFGFPPRADVPDGKENIQIKLDGLGTTYHEAGTLRMGTDPADSAVDPDLRFHGVDNAYVTDMSVVPTCGSANPVQPGVALARRLARHLARPSPVLSGGMFLFEDRPTPFWRMAGAPATCARFGFGELEITSAGGPFGLYWCTVPTPADFELSLDWLSTDPADNSGVFIRFPDPDKAPPRKAKAFTNPGAVAVEYGFEVQIDASEGGGDPLRADGQVAEAVPPRFRGTGAVYNEPSQDLRDVPALAPNRWHGFIIRAQGPEIEVDLRVDGGPPRPRARFIFDPARYGPCDLRGDPARGLPTRPGADRDALRYIGLQAHDRTALVKFRNIFIKPL